MKLCSTEKRYNNWKRGTVIMSGFGFPHHVIVIYICIYILFEPKINFRKDNTMATTTYRSASYLVLHLEIEERLSTKLYDKRDDLNFPIVNIP
jgi:hypothetical protein